MKEILLLCSTLMLFRATAQNPQEKTSNNVLEFKLTDGTPIPQGDGYSTIPMTADTSRWDLWINHRATLKDLMKIKTICRRRGLYLNYRNLIFDERQKLVAIEVEYAMKHGNVAVAAAQDLKDSTKFGVFGRYTAEGLRYYIGYRRE
jgi:hypothetical protein